MRTEPISREIHSGLQDPPSDIQMLMHAAWLLAGVAIALAGCTAADEADLHAAPSRIEANQNVARFAPQTQDSGGNVQDMTY
jgi:hypothetical protein